MSDKPSYLGLLNAIAVNEARAQRYLSVWIGTTGDPDVAAVLRAVAWREGEHGMSFAKRVNELGFEVREKHDPSVDEQLAVAGSDKSDLEKMRFFGLDRLDETLRGFDGVFADHSIDIRTGELLGRYVAEEFDTARLLRCCYERLAARHGAAAPDAAGLAALNDKVDALCRAVEELRQIVCAQTMPTEAS
ncbi:MAG TPA: hypothetical protein VMV22_03720 [Acidimicrobiales bacterium]|nr:hypothetical protein [Acidimicrobiales bacterium]